MNKIIRRTIIVTITETWTIVWPDESEYGQTQLAEENAPNRQGRQNTQVFRKSSLVEVQVSTAPTPIEVEYDDARFA